MRLALQDLGISVFTVLWSITDNLPVLGSCIRERPAQYAFMDQPCSFQSLLLHSLERMHSRAQMESVHLSVGIHASNASKRLHISGNMGGRQ